MNRVADDRGREEEDRDERREQIDRGREAAELDERREQQRREAVEQRRAMSDVDVGMGEAVLGRGHLPVLPDAEDECPEEDQAGREDDRLGVAADLHSASASLLRTPHGDLERATVDCHRFAVGPVIADARRQRLSGHVGLVGASGCDQL